MSNTRKLNPSRPEADNPEWTREDMAKARPAAEVLPRLIGAKATEELFRRGRGRPPLETRKVNQTIRLDPDVLAAYQQGGARLADAHQRGVARAHARATQVKEWRGRCALVSTAARPQFEIHALLRLKMGDDAEQVFRGRLAVGSKHSHEAGRRDGCGLFQPAKTNRGIDVVAQHHMAGLFVVGEHFGVS